MACSIDEGVQSALRALARIAVNRERAFAKSGSQVNIDFAAETERKEINAFLKQIPADDQDVALEFYQDVRSRAANDTLFDDANGADKAALAALSGVVRIDAAGDANQLDPVMSHPPVMSLKTSEKLALLFAFAAVVFIGYLFVNRDDGGTQGGGDSVEMQEIKLQRLVRGFVEGHLRDPDSAQFRNQHGTCGEVNAKNALGGYTGYNRFIAVSKDLVVMEDSGLSQADFEKVWDGACKESPTGAKRR